MILLLVVVLLFALARFAGLFAVLFVALFMWLLENPGGFLLLIGLLLILCDHYWGLLPLIAGFFMLKRRW